MTKRPITWHLDVEDAVTILDALDHAVVYWTDRADELLGDQRRYAQFRVSAANILAQSAHDAFGL